MSGRQQSGPAAGGGRWVLVEPERLAGWLRRFAERHGPLDADATGDVVRARAADGALAECEVPFPPLRISPGEKRDDGAAGVLDPSALTPVRALIEHASRQRRVGVLLVRRGGFAAGVFDGARLETAKVGQRHVQGRTAAGGWSQQRFARRREGQSRVALEAAADAAALVLLPEVGRLDAVVVGGDRRGADEVLADTRLAPLRDLVVATRLDVPDPRRRVLELTPATFRATRIRVTEPAARG